MIADGGFFGTRLKAVPKGFELARAIFRHEVYLDPSGSRYERTLAESGRAVVYERYADPENRTHRSGGLPAETRWTEPGTVRSKEWFVDGRRSRLDGPARIRHLDDGTREEWFLIGSRASSRAEFERIARFLIDKAAEFRAREVECSVFGPLLVSGAEVDSILEGVHRGVTTVEGMAAFLDGAPAEWVKSFESAPHERAV